MKILAELIKDAGIKKSYFLYGRSDTIVKNPELIKLWKDIGLEKVFVGLEFFRGEDLKYINKGSTVENNKEAVKDSLITTDYDLFDFIHTELPTKLPLKEFFKNLNSLYFDAKSPRKSISFIMKYPLKEIPNLIYLTMKIPNK